MHKRSILELNQAKERKLLMDTLIVRGAPEEYICEVGSWNHLEKHLIRRHLKKVLILHGEKSFQVAKPFLPTFEKIEVIYAHYQNECRFDIAEKFKQLAQAEKIDGVVAIGGGKVLDLGKLIANDLKIKSICLPTLASTCAAYTPVSIVYNEKHEMIDFKILDQSVSLTLIDPQVILNSPKNYLIAGIGDTLAKWYEADPIISAINQPSVEVEIAHFAAKSCQTNLLTFGIQAIEDLEREQLSDSLIKVIETNILLAGMVGGFGDKYGRTSGAHSIHDALTLIPKTNHLLHGNKVAYGILVQLAIEDKWSEIATLIPLFNYLDIPTKYSQMAIETHEIIKVATEAAKDECMQLLPLEITADKIILAIEKLENFEID